ncbi:Uncharacterized protein HZ326_18514 [Fusarium oxysporum f. sp. albedinis]|nr:Uncharacterized protein HZ326_18514 [Fusarium oxysporum f. sp. albedinis]
MDVSPVTGSSATCLSFSPLCHRVDQRKENHLVVSGPSSSFFMLSSVHPPTWFLRRRTQSTKRRYSGSTMRS